MDSTFIYTLADSRSGEIRYVGKTDDPAYRAKTHLRNEPTAKGRWVQYLLANAAVPVLEVLDEVPFSEWMFWEQYWIQFLRGNGCRLLNGDNGGLGHYRITPDVCKKISATLKGRPNTALQMRVFAYTLSGEFHGEFESFAAAGKAAGGDHSNICRSVKDGRSAYGFIWKKERVERIETCYVDGRIPPSEAWVERCRLLGRATKGRKVSDATREKQRQSALRRPAKSRAEAVNLTVERE